MPYIVGNANMLRAIYNRDGKMREFPLATDEDRLNMIATNIHARFQSAARRNRFDVIELLWGWAGDVSPEFQVCIYSQRGRICRFPWYCD